MKKRIILIAIIGLLLLMLPLIANADPEIVASGTCGDGVSWTLDDTGLLTISGNGFMDDYNNVYNAPYAKFSPWYDSRTSINSVVIDYGVKNIGHHAFYDCSSLTSIAIPDSVTSISYEAFQYCSSLCSVSIPSGVTSIGSNLFCGCSKLSSVSIPPTVTTIEAFAFRYCENLSNISIPNSVTRIARFAFDSSGLQSIIIPRSVTSIAESAFSNCFDLESVTIPNSVTSIGVKAFWNCHKLSSILLPNSITSIGELAFEHCTSLTKVSIPNSVSNIGMNAFNNCDLTDTIIPDTVTTIGPNAFANCQSIRLFVEKYSQAHLYALRNHIPYEITGAGSTPAFELPSALTQIETSAFEGTACQVVVVPESTESIGDDAFKDCEDLKAIIVVATPTDLSSTAFDSDDIMIVVGN